MTRFSDAFHDALRSAGIPQVCEVCGHAPIDRMPRVLAVEFPERPRICRACGIGFDPSGEAHGYLSRDGQIHVPVLELIYDVGDEPAAA